jgi:hypothetical protein
VLDFVVCKVVAAHLSIPFTPDKALDEVNITQQDKWHFGRMLQNDDGGEIFG